MSAKRNIQVKQVLRVGFVSRRSSCCAAGSTTYFMFVITSLCHQRCQRLMCRKL